MKKVLVILIFCMVAISLVLPFTTLNAQETESKTLKIDLYVMSMCPYGINAESIFYELQKKYTDLLDINIYFIASENKNFKEDQNTENRETEKSKEASKPVPQGDDVCVAAPVNSGGRFQSLHGDLEVDEDIRQLLIIKYFPESYWEYINLRNQDLQNSNPVTIMKQLNIDSEIIESLVSSEEGKSLLSENIKNAESRNVNASPTVYVDGKIIEGALTENKILRKLCQGNEIDVCSSIPVCEEDTDCTATAGMIAVCMNPGAEQAQCVTGEAVQFTATIITDKRYPVINSKEVEDALKRIFTGIKFEVLDYSDDNAKTLLEKYKIDVLPAYILDKEVDQSLRFAKFSMYVDKRIDKYVMPEKYLANRYYLKRDERKGAIELYVNSISKQAAQLENILLLSKNISFSINYNVIVTKKKVANQLVVKENTSSAGTLKPVEETYSVSSPYGEKDIREGIKQLCISRYNPEYLTAYLRCVNNETLRDNNENKCAQLIDLNKTKVSECENGNEGISMLAENSIYSRSLEIGSEVAVLIHNNLLLQNFDINTVFKQLEGN